MFTLRPAQPTDADFLAEMLVEAVNWDPNRPRHAAEDLLGAPKIAHYVAGWPRHSDVGVVAVDRDGRRIGACWLRFFAADDPGYGFVAPDIPEVSLAVVSAWRGRGVGRALLRALAERAGAAGIAKLSLSVELGNRALDLYRGEGYVIVASDAETATLVKDLSGDDRRAIAMNDQRRHWDDLYARRLQRHAPDPSPSPPAPFAVECERLLAPGSRVIEFGCGSGWDAAFFAERGHTVCATDFSAVVLAANVGRAGARTNAWYVALDTSRPLPFAAGAFDAAYAHLSLHYFTDAVTRRVVREIRRVLRPGGLLCFRCKSTDDPLHGLGRQIESNMFELDGHVRHFFSEAYARSCLGDDFAVVRLASGTDALAGSPSRFVEVVARAN